MIILVVNDDKGVFDHRSILKIKRKMDTIRELDFHFDLKQIEIIKIAFRMNSFLDEKNILKDRNDLVTEPREKKMKSIMVTKIALIIDKIVLVPIRNAKKRNKKQRSLEHIKITAYKY